MLIRAHSKGYSFSIEIKLILFALKLIVTLNITIKCIVENMYSKKIFRKLFL